VNRLRVLSVINSLYFGGAECRLLSLSRSIDRERFDQRVLTLKVPDAKREHSLGGLRPHFLAAGIAVDDLGEEAPELGSAHGTAVKVARSVPRLARTLAKLRSYIRENRIDVVDTHTGTANQIGIAAAVFSNRPVVATTYGLEVFRPLWVWRSSESAMFTAASAIVTDSEAVAGQVRRKVLRPRHVAVIPNGIAPPQTQRTREEMHARFGIPLDPNVRVIGQVASLTPRKGHLILLDAAYRLTRADPNVHFLICGYARGWSDYERALHVRTAELGLSPRVHFVEYPGPVGDVFCGIDVQVHAATQESLPQAIIEGMALAKPAVVTAIAGIPAMVSDGESGLVVPPDDAAALATALARLLQDGPLATRLGAAARQRYLANYTDLQMARRLEAIFAGVALPVAA
jgi:glycosyltransferase involved in cell wall biosynthesis